MTREHVFSDWLQREIGAMESQTEGTPGDVTRGLFKVRDVCGRCNNGPLSVLDAYAKKLWDAYFSDLDPPALTPFRADFHKLTRYLMKTAYNDARKAAYASEQAGGGKSREHSEQVNRHKLFADYIRGAANDPPLALDVLGGTRPGPVHPSVGVGDVSLVGDEHETYLIRWVHVGSFSFIVNVWNTGVSQTQRRETIDSVCQGQDWVILEGPDVDVELEQIAAPTTGCSLHFIDPAGKAYQP